MAPKVAPIAEQVARLRSAYEKVDKKDLPPDSVPLELRSGKRALPAAKWQDYDFRIITNPQQKGGVGKTTSALNLAVSIAASDEDVLIVDLDTQCNLTHALCSKLVDMEFGGDYSAFAQFIGFTDTVFTVLRDARRLHQNDVGSRTPQLLKIDFNIMSSILHPNLAVYLPPHKFADVFLLQGDADLNDWSDDVVNSLKFGQFIPSERSVPAMLYRLVQRIAADRGIKYVVMDLSPGNTLFNRLAIAMSHAFFIPVGIDVKNKQALRQSHLKFYPQIYAPVWPLGSVVAGDIGTLAKVHAIQQGLDKYAPGHSVFPEHKPKYLGLIFSRVGYQGCVSPYNHYAIILEQVRIMHDQMMPFFQQQGLAMPVAYYDDVLPTAANARIVAPHSNHLIFERGVAAMIKEFNSVVHMSERESIPVPFLQQHHYRTIRPEIMAALAAGQIAALPVAGAGDPFVPVASAVSRADYDVTVAHTRKEFKTIVDCLKAHHAPELN